MRQLRTAFEIGIRHGRATDLDNLQRDAQIRTTRLLLLKLMEVQRLDLNSAMNILMIPKKEQSTYIRLLAQQVQQRAKT